jgi:hypothetical protein
MYVRSVGTELKRQKFCTLGNMLSIRQEPEFVGVADVGTLLHLPGKMTEQQTIDVESQIQVARGVFICLFMAAWRNLSLLVGTQRNPLTDIHLLLLSTLNIFGSVNKLLK